MKQLIYVSALTLCACASSDALQAPKTLPDNWVSEQPHYMPAKVQETTLHWTTDNMPGSSSTSLWSSSPKSLFGDRRASQSGDILTVLIEIDDEAEMKNSVNQSRTNSQDFGVSGFLGLPQVLNGILPAGSSMTNAVDLDKASNIAGNGNIKREEKLTLRLAARVIGVMPNGYLKLAGKQEIMVNDEVRYLQVTGLIRTQDISRKNTITYDKIADARIFYGGQGQLSSTVHQRRSDKFLRRVVPF